MLIVEQIRFLSMDILIIEAKFMFFFEFHVSVADCLKCLYLHVSDGNMP